MRKEHLQAAIEQASRVLPLQGPIGAYWHHNILLAFQHLPFHDAVAQASDLLNARDYLAESQYMAAFERGRITADDVEGALAAEVSRPPPLPAAHRSMRIHRDHVLDRFQVDIHDTVHEFLIRTLAAYLDLGVAYWPMPERGRGFYASFVDLYARPGHVTPTLLRGLARELQRQRTERLSALDVIDDQLVALGIDAHDRAAFLTRMLLSLRGWAGMVRRLELNPRDRPEGAPPASLIDYLAVRITLEHVALRNAVQQTSDRAGPMNELLRPSVPTNVQAQRSAAEADEVDRRRSARVVPAFGSFEGRARRRIWHEAYEWSLHRRVLDAISVAAKRRPVSAAAPTLQALFCIDIREESLRRHIEEQDPGYLTYGIAGFFGLPIWYRGIDDAQHTAQAPFIVTPKHVIEELPVDNHLRRAGRRRLWARVLLGVHAMSRSMARAALLTPILGALATIPLVLRVLVPRTAWAVQKLLLTLALPKVATRLGASPDDYTGPTSATPPCSQRGFDLDEQADLVATQLENLGMRRDFAPIVLVIGHGSSSVNNPHKSAYDCGACGGNTGGPNARLFAQLANTPAVRALLRARGVEIPDGTHFVGGCHDTTKDAIAYYDTELVPASHRARFQDAQQVVAGALALNAHERARRFASAPHPCTPAQALRHVEGRSEDLSQARPEYGNCANAACVIGRRALTRGLFLDRRAFLASYDPGQDTDQRVLERVMATVVTVGAGINLQYFGSTLDNERYGAGSKLAHNLTGMLGVMDGTASDLRTGLPLQGIELHEPVRLLVVVEATAAALLAVAERQAEVRELVVNRWIQLASVDPDTGAIQWFNGSGFEPYQPGITSLPQVSASRDWYDGKRDFWDFLPPALIARGLPAKAEVTHAA